MTVLGKGVRVMLVNRESDMPPLGTRGIIVSATQWGPGPASGFLGELPPAP